MVELVKLTCSVTAIACKCNDTMQVVLGRGLETVGFNFETWIICYYKTTQKEGRGLVATRWKTEILKLIRSKEYMYLSTVPK